jgi:hypothetical protein
MKESYEKVMQELRLFHGLPCMLGHQYSFPTKNKLRDLLLEFKKLVKILVTKQQGQLKN